MNLYYEEEIKALNESKIEYLIVGGIAVNLYGLFRMTQDLDVMINISEETLEQFKSLMKKMGYETRVSIEKQKDVVAITFINKKEEYKRIDVFIKNPIDFEKAFKRRKMIKLGDTRVSCVSLDDLFKLKEMAGRDRDLIDIGYLRKFKNEGKLNE